MTGNSTSSSKLTVEELRRVLSYDVETGLFTWRVRVSPVRGAGEPAGSVDGTGYIFIMYRRKRYLAHRLAWFHVTGAWPAAEIDHVDGSKDNNRFANLREATRSQNQMNTGMSPRNTSGFKGVFWHVRHERWYATIRADGKAVRLGNFRSPEKAHEAYEKAAARLHGEFRRGHADVDIFA